MRTLRFHFILVSLLVLPACVHQGRYWNTPPGPPVAHWSFEDSLKDGTVFSNDAFVLGAEFADGRQGRALRLGSESVTVNDCAELRLAPGLRLECWVKFDALGAWGRQILVKEKEYMLRVNPGNEGSQFAFFVYLDGKWESRVQLDGAVEVGEWYHLVAGWDGKEIWLAANGKRAHSSREGLPVSRQKPVCLGPIAGLMDEVRIENPQASQSGVVHCAFDGSLCDDSGHGHDLTGAGASFVPGRRGQALQVAEEALELPSDPTLHLAPGLRIDCTVRFDRVPTDCEAIVIKDGEYMLRVNPPNEGGCFGFFVNVGNWEPRVSSEVRVQPGVWYRVIAAWDGHEATLSVNGNQADRERFGMPKPTDNPVRIGVPGCVIDDLRIENPRQPLLQLKTFETENVVLCAGRSETLRGVFENLGCAAVDAAVDLQLPAEVRSLDGTVRKLGNVGMGETRTVTWTVQANEETTATGRFRLTAENAFPATPWQTLAFLPASLEPTLCLPVSGNPGNTYYIDSVAGDNANSGEAPEKPWRDFANINGKTLGPGDKLLIKRGSVVNQELSLSASGTRENWAEIGTYGTGPRPTIRRNWDIDDRCALISDPKFLHIRGLVVCYAGKGLVVCFRRSGAEGLVIEDCIAHHIEGLYRRNSHGIPEWLNREGAPGDGLGSSAGIAVMGAGARNVLIRDCEMFQTSWGFRGSGSNLTVDRVYCHDNYTYNTSPHPALTSIRRSFLQNSILDAPGYHAHAGTMGIMLCWPYGLIIRNCTFRNMPHSGNHDEGGIDFECGGLGCIIDECTFRNNAGAAIEVLGLKSPQCKNIEIKNSRFIKNNTQQILGPSEIFVWSKKRPDPKVCCSTGTIHDNGYILNPGISFYVNDVPQLTDWKLEDNTEYKSVEALEKAMPHNNPPDVNAGAGIHTDSLPVPLNGRVSDDGRPNALRVKWEVMEGPGKVLFENAAVPGTTATFACPGDYLLRLVADDGQLWLSDMCVVHVLPKGRSVLKSWEFNTPLDKEEWTEVNPGTKVQEWKNQRWPCKSHPVKYVAGGHYIVALDKSPDAHLLSPDVLGVDLRSCDKVILRFQNHTPATSMRLSFRTTAVPTWSESKSRCFEVAPNDTNSRSYCVDMSGVSEWAGQLRQLKIELATGLPLTGTCRVDYIWLCK